MRSPLNLPMTKAGQDQSTGAVQALESLTVQETFAEIRILLEETREMLRQILGQVVDISSRLPPRT